jgi:hypothetical protein
MEPTTEERNEAIAVFMELKRESYRYAPSQLFYNHEGYLYEAKKLEYNSNMDWLYPVCQKINEMDTREISTYLAHLQNDVRRVMFKLATISKIFIHASDFCMEYNKLNKK